MHPMLEAGSLMAQELARYLKITNIWLNIVSLKLSRTKKGEFAIDAARLSVPVTSHPTVIFVIFSFVLSMGSSRRRQYQGFLVTSMTIYGLQD